MTQEADMNKADEQPNADLEKGGFGGKPPFDTKKDGETDDEMKRDKMDKSIDSDTLGATIGLLQETLSKSQAGRTQELMQKGATVGLTSDESEELRKSLAGEQEESLSNDIEKSMNGDEDLNKSMQLDVSGFLTGIQGSVTDALSAVANRLEKGFKDAEDTSFVLAKALLDVCKVQQAQAELIKSVKEDLANYGRQPAHAPRAARSSGQAEALSKGFGPNGDEKPQMQLTKSDILETLHEMSLHKSYANQSRQLGDAIAQYESVNEISPALLDRVVDFRKGLQG